ncbi:MAG: NERD domain-containing protein [Clostridiales bacterium]|nr:NERD domain-containing protein [Clostridiales bacterium]
MEKLEYIVVSFLLMAVYKIVSPFIRGMIGEIVVRFKLMALPFKEYKVLNNIMLKTKKGTTQIDHIVVSVYGIFVIETKNYKGTIIGVGNKQEWIKSVHGAKYYFKNPVIQNKGHVNAIVNNLSIKEEFVIPIVVFSNECRLNVKTNSIVILLNKLIPTIRGVKVRRFTKEQLNSIVRHLKALNQSGCVTKIKHIAYVKKKEKTRKSKRY